jgi:hypothetical protein
MEMSTSGETASRSAAQEFRKHFTELYSLQPSANPYHEPHRSSPYYFNLLPIMSHTGPVHTTST